MCQTHITHFVNIRGHTIMADYILTMCVTDPSRGRIGSFTYVKICSNCPQDI